MKNKCSLLEKIHNKVYRYIKTKYYLDIHKYVQPRLSYVANRETLFFSRWFTISRFWISEVNDRDGFKSIKDCEPFKSKYYIGGFKLPKPGYCSDEWKDLYEYRKFLHDHTKYTNKDYKGWPGISFTKIKTSYSGVKPDLFPNSLLTI